MRILLSSANASSGDAEDAVFRLSGGQYEKLKRDEKVRCIVESFAIYKGTGATAASDVAFTLRGDIGQDTTNTDLIAIHPILNTGAGGGASIIPHGMGGLLANTEFDIDPKVLFGGTVTLRLRNYNNVALTNLANCAWILVIRLGE